MHNKKSMPAKRGVHLFAAVAALVVLVAVATPSTSLNAETALICGSKDDHETTVSERGGSDLSKTLCGSADLSGSGYSEPTRIEVAEHTLRSHDLDNRMAPAKPMSVLHFVRPVRYQADSGESLEVSLTLVAAEAVKGVTIEARVDAGLVLTANARHFVGSLEAGREVTLTFSVSALAEGRHYVNVVAAAEGVTGRRISSYSIPVEVGNVSASGSQKSESRVVTDDQGNRLILMQAEAPKEGGQLR